MTTVTDQTVHRQRAAALTTLAQLADHHSLPMPLSMSFLGENYPTRLLEIRLDNDRPGSVRDWAKVLGLGAPMSTDHAGKNHAPFTSVKAKAWARDGGPLWLGFDTVEVWTACRANAAENGDDYSREPDNADDPQPVPSGVDGGSIGSGPGRTAPAETPKDDR